MLEYFIIHWQFGNFTVLSAECIGQSFLFHVLVKSGGDLYKVWMVCFRVGVRWLATVQRELINTSPPNLIPMRSVFTIKSGLYVVSSNLLIVINLFFLKKLLDNTYDKNVNWENVSVILAWHQMVCNHGRIFLCCFQSGSLHHQTMSIMKKALAILQIFAISQLGCGGREFQRNLMKRTAKGNHWG